MFRLSPSHLLVTLLFSSTLAASQEAMPPSLYQPTQALQSVAVEVMEPLDNQALAARSRNTDELRPGPLRFAQPLPVGLDPASSGSWEVLDDGSRLWRLRISSPGARSLNLGFSHFDLPPGGALWLYDLKAELVQGPYTQADRTAFGELWTAIVPADEVVVELHLPPGSGPAELTIGKVNHGFRDVGPQALANRGVLKQGSCQNDVICRDADPWRRQVRAVAWYSVEGEGACTGNLVNNTAQDGRPFFLSADHCGITRRNASSVVVYWNYESPTCGRLSGGSLAHNQSGSVFRASYEPSDFVLVELTKQPGSQFNVYYAGWNAVNRAPRSAVGIHHPNLDEKAISFADQPLYPDGPTHWGIVWNDGTTEPGSSGSCIFDGQGRCVGTLTGGSSFCHDPSAPDYYGRFSVHWTGGGTKASSLRPWLDPLGNGTLTLGGRDSSGGGNGGGGGGGGGGGDDGGGGGGGGGGNGGGGGGTCGDTALCFQDGRFQMTVGWSSANQSGQGKVAAASATSGTFSLTAADRWDLLVTTLDRCATNNRFKVYASSTSSLAFTLRMTNTQTGAVRTYEKSIGGFAAPVVRTFTCN